MCYEMKTHNVKPHMLDSETNRYSVINYIEENGLINPNDYHNKKGEVRRIELSDRVKIELSLTKL